MTKPTMRDRAGRYDYTNMDLVCQCGHRLGVHLAGSSKSRAPRECINHEVGEGADINDHCPCEGFKPAKAG